MAAKKKKETLEDSKLSAALEKKATNSVLTKIKKKYGNVLSPLSEANNSINTVSTGSLSLDLALGRGGMALGRVYEVYGPNSSGKSTLGVHVVIQAQRRGLKCAYLDAEVAVDPKLFANYGVDSKKLDLVQVYGGEPNLDILQKLIETGAYSVIVIDSVSALIPMSEAEADIDKDHMALQARLMSKALRKIAPKAAENNTLLIFVNQLRMKLGGYGCFHYDTLVNFVDGPSLPIGKVVNDKIQGEVWCFNEKLNKVESKPIINWYDNGDVTDKDAFIHIQTASINGRGRFGLTCTTNHKILTDSGWKEAGNLSFEDKLVSKYEETINGTYGDFLSGILIGDSYISVRHKNTGSLRLQDNENKDYINWKLDKLSNFIDFNELKMSRGYRYDSNYTYEFAKIKRDIGTRDPMYFLNNYTDLGFALWLMDDGNLDLNNGHRRYGVSIKRFKNNVEKCNEIKNKFIKLGFVCNYTIDSGFFQFETSITDKIALKICKYIPKCMEYKLPFEYRDRYKEFILENKSQMKTDLVEIKEIREASDRQLRKRRKFDISVENNHNYMVGGKYNGVFVHNSPETTTGGEALGFWTTGRISIRGPEARKRRLLDDAGEVYGHIAAHEVQKNKLGEPFKKANLNLIYNKGYDFYNEVLEMAVSMDIVEKAGSWFKYKDENLAQGNDKTLAILKENTKLFNEIRTIVIETVGLKEQYELHSNPGPLYPN